MSETFTMNETPANVEVLNSDEQDSLAVAESLEAGEQPLLAGKFKDQQSLEKAYIELQQKLGEPRQEVPEPEEQGEAVEASEPEQQEEEVEEGPVVLSQKQVEQLFEMVGGEQEYQNMTNWAASNFTKDEISMFDNVIERGDPESVFFAVQALKARYSDNVGNDGQLLTGNAPSNRNDSFQSQAELVEAMNDPRYDRDPAYRKDVMRRLETSNVDF